MYEIINIVTGNVFMTAADPKVISAAIIHLPENEYQVKMLDGKMRSLASASWELE